MSVYLAMFAIYLVVLFVCFNHHDYDGCMFAVVAAGVISFAVIARMMEHKS